MREKTYNYDLEKRLDQLATNYGAITVAEAAVSQLCAQEAFIAGLPKPQGIPIVVTELPQEQEIDSVVVPQVPVKGDQISWDDGEKGGPTVFYWVQAVRYPTGPNLTDIRPRIWVSRRDL